MPPTLEEKSTGFTGCVTRVHDLRPKDESSTGIHIDSALIDSLASQSNQCGT